MKENVREIRDESQVVEVQKILALLVEFDERTGRYKRYGDPETHYARKAVSVANPSNVWFEIEKKDEDSLYFITAHVTIDEALALSTSWLHEDGIRNERKNLGSSHPVHKIVCMTDVFEKAQEVQSV